MVAPDELRRILVDRLRLVPSAVFDDLRCRFPSDSVDQLLDRFKQETMSVGAEQLPRLSPLQRQRIRAGQYASLLHDGGRYVQVRELGEGGGGSVVLAIDSPGSPREKLVALKFPRLSGRTAATRFEAECRILCDPQLKGVPGRDNVVQGLRHFQEGSQQVLVMDYVRGVNLDTWVREMQQRGRSLPLLQVLRLLRPVLDGVAFLHDHKLVHRDIKPANLLLVDSQQPGAGAVRIVDLGIVKDADNKITVHPVMGSPYFSAPECFVDASGADERADLYSLAATTWFLLCGQPPTAELCLNPGNLQLAGRGNHDFRRWTGLTPGWEPPDIRDIRHEIPAALSRMLRTSLAHDPENRSASLHDFRSAVGRIVHDIKLLRELVSSRMTSLYVNLSKRMQDTFRDLSMNTFDVPTNCDNLMQDMQKEKSRLMTWWSRLHLSCSDLRSVGDRAIRDVTTLLNERERAFSDIRASATTSQEAVFEAEFERFQRSVVDLLRIQHAVKRELSGVY